VVDYEMDTKDLKKLKRLLYKDLTSPKYRARIVKSKVKYNRKRKHKGKHYE